MKMYNFAYDIFIALLIVLIISCCQFSNASNKSIGVNGGQSCDDLYETNKKLIDQVVDDYRDVEGTRDHGAALRAEASLFFTLEGCPSDIRFLNLMSRLQMMKGNNKTALSYANRALLLNNNDPIANESRGSALLLLGQSNQGIKYIARAAKLAPDNTEIAFIYCSSLEWIGKYNSAIEVCSEVINTGSNIAAATYIRGRAYDAIGKNKKASEDYERAKEFGYEPNPYQ